MIESFNFNEIHTCEKYEVKISIVEIFKTLIWHESSVKINCVLIGHTKAY